MKKIPLILFSLIYAVGVNAQDVLQHYIHEGLQNNEGIKQQAFILQSNVHALREARSLFFPTLTVSGSYSKSDGGRTIDLPLGDLLNPIYSSLNELTGTQHYPMIQNQNYQLNADNFYDAKVRIGLPIFDAELIYNRRIKQNAVSLQETEISLFKRELVKEIKVAYYQYCRATRDKEIAANNLTLTQENYRVNQAMYENEMANYSTFLRSESEVTKAEAAVYSAGQTWQNSRAYFNFLLNKSFDDEIVMEDMEPDVFHVLPGQASITGREEIQKVDLLSAGQRYNQLLSRSFALPTVRTYLDLGSQGFDWKLNDKTKYYVFGVSLEWTFSTGGKNIHRMRQAQAGMNALGSQSKQMKDQLDLQRVTCCNAYRDALNNYHAVRSGLGPVERYYRDVEKRYKQGNALYVELLEAQTHYFNTQMDLNIAFYNVCIKYAEYERAIAGFNLTNQ